MTDTQTANYLDLLFFPGFALMVVLGMVSLGLFLYVQPLLTIRALAKALDESDVETIREEWTPSVCGRR